MPDEPIRHHIAQATRRTDMDTRRLILRMVGSCWPGGVQDRSEQVAVQWLRRWRPDIVETRLPVCTCRIGHCAICN
jgi:hypothetical protein